MSRNALEVESVEAVVYLRIDDIYVRLRMYNSIILPKVFPLTHFFKAQKSQPPFPKSPSQCFLLVLFPLPSLNQP